jgi:glycosyltransferase involved in cell wall biosynthesis
LKLCFISGPYKPGSCGITDYVTLLCRELNKHVNTCKNISIERNRSFSDISKNIIEADLYSIQFAPYAFSSTGLSTRGLNALAQSLKNRKTHINFHEIWIGDYPNASWKEKTIGYLQKREILNFLNTLKPSLVTCSNAAALDRMQQVKINAKHLYLFGNIPNSIEKKNVPLKDLQVAFFGTPYDKFPYFFLAKKLVEISRSSQKAVHIKVIGRQREKAGIKEIDRISEINGFNISHLGELPESEISKELKSSDIGVSTTPYDILGKSGATAAMLEHGLPVMVFDDMDTPREKLFVMEQFEDQIFLLNDSSVSERLESFMLKPRKPFFDGVAFTTRKMLKLLH